MSERLSHPPDQHSASYRGSPRPRIHLLATGGTIAGTNATSVGLEYRAGELSFSTLLQGIPHSDSLAELSGEQFSNIGSQDMNETLWMNLARRVQELLAETTIDGVVITHGTDTIEETAYLGYGQMSVSQN